MLDFERCHRILLSIVSCRRGPQSLTHPMSVPSTKARKGGRGVSDDRGETSRQGDHSLAERQSPGLQPPLSPMYVQLPEQSSAAGARVSGRASGSDKTSRRITRRAESFHAELVDEALAPLAMSMQGGGERGLAPRRPTSTYPMCCGPLVVPSTSLPFSQHRQFE